MKNNTDPREEMAAVVCIKDATPPYNGAPEELGFRGFMAVMFPDFPADKVDECAREIREKHRR